MRSSARAQDQFYTRPDVAAACLSAFEEALRAAGIAPAWWLEPSAGTGAFLHLLPADRRTGLDVEPRGEGIEAADFLAWSPPEDMPRPIAAIGNPPFGRNASKARRFLEHASSFAALVGFILPRTFEKETFQENFRPDLRLVAQISLDPASFIFEGEDVSVPCVFQVWRPGQPPRPRRERPLSHPDFAFVGREEADFAFQRVGVRAGTVHRAFADRAAQSHHFVKDLSPERDVAEVLERIDWRDVKARTAGNPSIGKREMVEAYVEARRGG